MSSSSYEGAWTLLRVDVDVGEQQVGIPSESVRGRERFSVKFARAGRARVRPRMGEMSMLSFGAPWVADADKLLLLPSQLGHLFSSAVVNESFLERMRRTRRGRNDGGGVRGSIEAS